MDMINSLETSLINWNIENKYCAVIFRGAGKAFCAGGDVMSILKAHESRAEGDSRPNIYEKFFREEFTLDYGLAKMKPF